MELKNLGIENNTIVIYTIDNGAEILLWPNGGMTLASAHNLPILRHAQRDPFAKPGSFNLDQVLHKMQAGGGGSDN